VTAHRPGKRRKPRAAGDRALVAELKRRERELAKQKRILETTLDNIDQGITMVDEQLRTIALNRRFLELLGFPPESFARGFHMREAFRFNAERGEYGPGDVEAQVRQRLELARRFEPHAFERTRPDGTVIAIRGRPLAGGRGFVTTYSDVTEQRRAEAALRQARDEAEQALAEQMALRTVMEALGSSAFELQAVLRTLIESATRLAGADRGSVFRAGADGFRLAADSGGTAELLEHMAAVAIAPGRDSLVGRTALEARVVQIDDVLADPDYRHLNAQRMGRYRTALGVPLLRDGAVIGVITLFKTRVEPFTPAQIALVSTFSKQAAVAIENARLFNETKEALEQQTATSNILRVISTSLTDLEPVFDAILESAQRLFQCDVAGIWRFDGTLLHFVGSRGGSAEGTAHLKRHPLPLGDYNPTPQAGFERRVVHVPDVFADARYRPLIPPDTYGTLPNSGTVLAVPLLRGGELLGVITLWRQGKGPFNEQQIAMVTTFADQAVIAIENVRLFNETREALEQQTATAEILKVISSSPVDTQPVFEAIVQSGLKLFPDAAIAVALPADGAVRVAAIAEADAERAAAWRARFPFPLSRDYMHGAAILEARVIDVPDARDAPPGLERGCANFLASGYRAATIVPMLHGGEAIGAISVLRLAPGPLGAKQLALLRTFASQAVIAIENVRLLKETREALERQTASAEVLAAISSSIADARPVFDKILESCERLFTGRIVGLNLVGEDGKLRIGAYHGGHREQFERIFPLPVTPESGSGLALVERRIVHYPDAENGAEVPARTRQGCRAIGIKSVIFAPLLWEGRGLGAIFVGRDHVSSFSEKEIALLRTFADQAVIAIQNARLFQEIQDKSREVEVANRHKSEFLANMSHELRTPLTAIIGFARIVRRNAEERLEARQLENLDKILASGEHLLALINAILDLSKVEAGRVEVHAAEVALAPVLEQCLRTIEPLVKAEAVTLAKDFDGALPAMLVDEEKLRQIVINLLANAAKFTERGSIRLQARAANGAVAIAVADTGIGIAADKLEQIFEEFRQADASSTRVHGGTGLGLTIARRLARLMGGDIGVQSALGRGSTFTLTLPLRYQA
jgi:PAS domain S-box-containing protein